MLVINTSGTLNAALQAKRVYGTHYANHIFQRSSLHSLKPRVYAAESGSAEMPSAGRAFTLELITRLVAQGVQIAPLILHTGLSFEIMGRGSLSRKVQELISFCLRKKRYQDLVRQILIDHPERARDIL